MSQDKITVDEALVSTDVDRMIRTVAERGKLSLNELQQLCKIDKKNMDKWVRVLEDEGYIKIEYGLRGTYVLWKGGEIPPTLSENTVAQAAGLAPEPEDEPFEPAPEELLSQYLAKRKESDDGHMDNIKNSILTNLDDKKEEKAGAQVEKEPETEEVHEEAPEPLVEEEPEVAPVVAKRPPAVDTRELVSAYMEEINKEKAEVAHLQKERARLYREKFGSIEGQMEADIVALTERIIEKQNRVTELKERVLELPDKVDEVGKLQEQLNSLRDEGRGALHRTREKVDMFMEKLKQSKEQLKSKVEEIDEAIDRQDDKAEELVRLGASVDARLEKIRASAEATREQVEELNKTMSELNAELESAAQTKTEITNMTDVLRASVAEHGNELEALESELQGISNVERWVKEYVVDYEKKMDDIEQYVSKSEDDLSELREAAESLYMKKYLSELESMTEAYQSELHDAVTREEDIDQRISQSKARIAELVRDSQEMIRKLRSDPSLAKDFDSVRAAVRERTAAVKAVVEEKQEERMKLLEEAKTTRRSKAGEAKVEKVAVKARVAPSRPKHVSKAKKKKRR